MIQVRTGVFETNSSSTHSLILCMDDTYRRFKNGELFIDWENEEFIDEKELRERAKKAVCPGDPYHEKYPSEKEIDEMMPEEVLDVLDDWYEKYGAHNYRPGIHREIELPSGKVVHALSEFYYDD